MRKTVISIVTVAFLAAFAVSGYAEKSKSIKLLPPDFKSGKLLMEALKERKSSRAFSSAELPLNVLSNLLWVANGINRTDSEKRTAPTACNWQEIDIYAAMKNGLYLYNAKEHTLDLIMARDIRESAGMQAFVKDAPVVLIYVADFSKMRTSSGDSDEIKKFYSATDTGFVSQNVYLFCASEGLSTVVLGMVDKQNLSTVMKLRDDQKIILSQPAGYPK